MCNHCITRQLGILAQSVQYVVSDVIKEYKEREKNEGDFNICMNFTDAASFTTFTIITMSSTTDTTISPAITTTINGGKTLFMEPFS